MEEWLAIADNDSAQPAIGVNCPKSGGECRLRHNGKGLLICGDDNKKRVSGADMRIVSSLALAGLTALALAACGQKRAADTSEAGTPATTATAWPKALNPLGDGYPKAGDQCRRVGESAATVNFLDDSAVLVGCPATETAAIAALGGSAVGEVEGITIVSIPQGDANVGMPQSETPSQTRQGTSAP